MSQLDDVRKTIILHQINVSMPPRGLGYIVAGVIIVCAIFLMVIAVRYL